MLGKLHVANLSRTADGRNLEALFAGHGTVRNAEVITDPTAPSRNTGIGRVQMSTDEEATAAIAALNGTLYCGSTLKVGWAVPQFNADPADDVVTRVGSDRNGIAVSIESDAEAAKRLAGKIETLAMQAGSGSKREPAWGGAALDADAPRRPSFCCATAPGIPGV